MQVDIPPLVRISRVSDIWPANGAFEFTGGTSDLEAFDEVCIYSNMDDGAAAADYTVYVTGSGEAGALTLGCSTGVCTGDTIAYSVAWDDVSPGVSYTAFSGPGIGNTLSGFEGWSNLDDCANTDNASYRVTIANQAMIDTVNHGTYTGTLNIVITPSAT